MPLQAEQRLLHFIDYGGDAEVLLFLHGLGSRGQDWQLQIEALKVNYRVITVDFPGHGESATLHNSLSMADLALKVKQVLEELGLAKVHVIGLSLGGMVAFQLAVDFPHLLSSMVIINSAPGPGDREKKLKRQLRTRKWIIRLVGIDRLAGKIAKNLFPLPTQQNLRQQFIDSMAKVDKKTYLNIVEAIGNFNVDKNIRGCDIPTLVLSADKDYTSVAFKQAYVNQMTNAKLVVVPQSRHASSIDSPEFCNKEIQKFLTGLS